MRKLPRNGAPGRRLLFGRQRLAWLATWLQDRRRARQQAVPATPNAPVITAVDGEWGVTQANWADIDLTFTFVHGTYPVASIEIWKSFNGGAYVLLATVPSTDTSYHYALACDLSGGAFDFKARYVNGGTVGPYSNVYHLEVVPS